MFFSHVNFNELEANNPLVLKQTRAFVKGVDDFDVDKTYLYVIPGLEGQHERFGLLCERLKVPAVVLQPGLGHAQESIQGQARRFTEMLLKKMKLKDNFYLAAYESGVLVALEMLSILENKGYKGTLFCIGVPPEEVKGTIDEHLEGLYADEVHDAIIEAVSNTIVADKLELKEDLEACNSLEEKLEVATRKILNRKGVTIQYAKDLLKSAIGRVEEVRAYEPKPHRYNSKIILLTSESVNTESIHKYSKQNVHVYHLDTPLAHLTRDLRCSAVINQHLGPDILAEYEKRNILESYYTNTLKLVFKKRAE
ncbi:uncharacterized protein [Battus philenor]|uniref:uncharacterized protein n=1 Tax=Battus philenor TaxID=42288 RepID=UPI0035CF1841